MPHEPSRRPGGRLVVPLPQRASRCAAAPVGVRHPSSTYGVLRFEMCHHRFERL
ncbi:hypothetical protein [Nonomuraea rubra]|uniref:Uncharacterized protein n=1 Tax=Nonomuraea rubra TaxID=46180 RepID=A0A7X0NLZ2_9ACTN|nr:hypothetical protein [Nonomuraea rubra]MBB6545888.1 hypothetical protein [Nonomuraea rubra]